MDHADSPQAAPDEAIRADIYKPAYLLPVPYLNDVKALGLMTAAVSEAAWQDRCRKPLRAAENKENDKKRDDARKLRSLQLTERDVDYIKTAGIRNDWRLREGGKEVVQEGPIGVPQD